MNTYQPLIQARETLERVFGYPDFRPPQDAIVSDVIQGQDVLVIMPTGGGKSLCYQLPALIRPGTAIVISPLIALMQDQVSALSQWGIRAGCLNSSMSWQAVEATQQQLLAGQIDLLYIAPERLLKESTLALLRQCQLALFAVDEAHCVSQWGHDFRPEYLQLAQVMQQFPQAPVVALTATADQRTQKEIIERLQLRQASRYISGFDRPNIRYQIKLKSNAREQLLRFLRDDHPRDCGIIYCLSRKKVEETAQWLCDQGFKALPYHAGQSSELRNSNQHRFLQEEGLIMVATIAFGMGIDKPNVRFVAHLDLPKSIEAYYQETGRAGRDGLPADAWMVYGLQDVITLRYMLESSTAPEAQKMVEQQKLNAMLGLCEVSSCRRQVLLSYFDNNQHPPCDNCDNCLHPVDNWNATTSVQMALSCVYRTGQRFGVGHIIDVLCGHRTDKVTRFDHHQLSTWNIGSEHKPKVWRSIFRQLVARGYLDVDTEGFGTLKLAAKCRPVLKGEEQIFLRFEQPEKSKRGLKREAKQPKPVAFNGDDQQLWQALRDLRNELAQQQDVPAYIIFHDSTLRQMVSEKPQTQAAMRGISGVGERKLDAYGDSFLSVIRAST